MRRRKVKFLLLKEATPSRSQVRRITVVDEGGISGLVRLPRLSIHDQQAYPRAWGRDGSQALKVRWRPNVKSR